MYKQILLTLPALALATSCVPQDRPSATPPRRVQTAPALLRGLDLTVPADVAMAAPTIFDARARRPVVVPPFVALALTADDAARAAECLTAAVYYEARSEPVDGQRAVAQVVLNRVRDRAFPNSVCGVVFQGSMRRTGCQFSFTCDGSMRYRRDASAWDRARGVAAAALAGAIYAPVGSSTFYHAAYMLPWWAPSMARVGAVGAHVFYRWRGRLENALAFRQAYAGSEPGAARPWTTDVAAPILVHADQEVVGTVVIHRGGAVDAAPVSQTRMVLGVRVHLGRGQPVPDETAPDDPIAAEESVPI